MADALADGIAHHVAGRLAQAAGCYSRAIDAQPGNGDAWRLLGIIALQSGDGPAAHERFERAIKIEPRDVDAHSALGNLHELEGRLEVARTNYAAAHALDPAHPAAASGLARVTLRLGYAQEAIALAEAALARGTREAGLLRVLGAARLDRRDYAGAGDAGVAALQIAAHPDAYANLSAARVHQHRVGEAIDAARAALALDPAHAQAANNLGVAHKANDDFGAAQAAFERAIELGSEDAHVNLGTTRLLLGDYRGGWPAYGWVSAERRANPLYSALPMWDGAAAPGQRVVIWPEQGVGDTFQMVRFVERARSLVGRLTLACPAGTRDVLRTLAGVDEWIDAGALPSLDAFDLWLPTIRLPVIFDVESRSIPNAAYLQAYPARIERFAPYIATAAPPRVGVVWSGSPHFMWNEIRSVPPAQLAPLACIPGIAWFALQQGAARDAAAQTGLPLRPFGADIADFADTAAVLAQLDLVITVDTSVAHLAGALGKPVWVLLSNRPDWRWGRDGATTPWYPTARLFRQGTEDTWAAVIRAVAAALIAHVESAGQTCGG